MRSWTCLLCILACSAAALHGQRRSKEPIPGWLKLRGDPAAELELARGWRPPPVVTLPSDDVSIVREAPIWCSATAARKGYSPNAALPAPPRMLVSRPRSDMLKWFSLNLKGHEPVVLATDHAVLVMAVPGCDAKGLDEQERRWLAEYFPRIGRTLGPEERAVLYGLRYLRFEAMWRDLLGLLPGSRWSIPPFPRQHLGSRGRLEIYVFDTTDAYRQFGRHFFHGFSVGVSYWYDARADGVVVMVDGEDLPDAHVHSRLDHALAQGLLMHYRGYRHHIPAWIGCGMSHYFEKRHPGAPDTFATTGAPFVAREIVKWKRHWKKVVRRAVVKKRHTSFLDIGKVKFEGRMSQLEHAQCWSMVCFFLGLARERWRDCIDRMKIRENEDESLLEMHVRALTKAYEADLPTMERAWVEWVKRNR